MGKAETEKSRLAALERLGILDTRQEERFDRLTYLARRFYSVPIALFSLIDRDRQWFKSRQGLETQETPRSDAICDRAIEQDRVFIIEDAAKDPRFCNNPLVTGPPYIRFYAGMPVREPTGFKIGTLCIIDRKPRTVPDVELDVLRSLANLIEDEIERAYLSDHHQEFMTVSELNRAIQRAQNIFLTYEDHSEAFEIMLEDLLNLTHSQFGFIGEVRHNDHGNPFLEVGAITNIAWSPETKGLYQEVQRRGMRFERLDNMIGVSITAGKVIISNEFESDPRRGGLPEGHPEISAYMGIPIFSGDEQIGLVGLANRHNGYSPKIASELGPLLQTISQLIERKRLFEEKLNHKENLEKAANFDALTGLPNRRLMTELFERELGEADERQGILSICFIDLDGFKEINDTHGHSVGDAVLKTVADRLKSAVREHDIIARLGGDEFVAIIRDTQEPSIYRRILEEIRRPIPFRRHVLQLSGSMGVTVYPADHSDTDGLLRHADQAMYAAKESGKNQYQVFDLETHVSRKERVEILEQIPAALEMGQFELFLQPKIDLLKNRVEGFEALIRWQHPARGLLSPISFLGHLEYTEYAAEVGRFVIRDAVEKLKTWQEEGLDYSLSINLSPSHFISDDFVADLKSALAGCEASIRSRLILELLETTALDETDRVISLLTECRAQGVLVSLDDFGTGYSSLDYFRRLPTDEIKIDRSFVTDMLEDGEDELIVSAIIGLSKNFNKRIVAEGIENQETQDRMLEMGCRLVQGYFYTKPLPAAEALEWAREFHAARDRASR
ncbi:EAL domain-containing protein [Marinobacter pelagius]|uniref:sensor domain-containing phosphodiesterase n=1 Tax=Marinobacter sp. C7 TaxID=2951363 RepID=UPI001EF0D606|nr:EAL domain-containing protein [Marinobacter sp. C7]MCG7200714.1 EAL domain-containing protein [Marinobacter sp. C7]